MASRTSLLSDLRQSVPVELRPWPHPAAHAQYPALCDERGVGRSGDIAQLAAKIGIKPSTLAATIANYNSDAKEGRDPEFGRGSTIYQRHLGDISHKPNPCVAPILCAPFFAMRIYPADLGTAIGMKVDAQARVLREDDTPVAGLYACGNDMGSIMNGNCPGPGIALGPALTFGYIAGRHLAEGSVAAMGTATASV